MKRHIPGLHREQPQRLTTSWKASSWSASIGPSTAGIRNGRSTFCGFAILEPKEHQGHSLNGRLYCTPKALWKLSWFLRDFRL